MLDYLPGDLECVRAGSISSILVRGTPVTIAVDDDIGSATATAAQESREEIFRAFPAARLVAMLLLALTGSKCAYEAIFAGPHYDSNRYLHNNNWADAGLRVTWNLFNLISGPRQRELAEMQVEISKMQRLALNMAVLTQVHVAWQEHFGRQRQFELADAMFEIDQKIHEHTRTAAANDAQSKVNAIRSGVSALMAEYRRYQNYAAMQATYGQLIASLGEDPIPAGDKLAGRSQ